MPTFNETVYKDIILNKDLTGGARQLGYDFDISVQALHAWRHKGVPAAQVYNIIRHVYGYTNGTVRLLPHMLREDMVIPWATEKGTKDGDLWG